MSMVNLEKVKARYGGSIVNVQFDADIENGNVCYLGSLVNGEVDLYEAKKPLTATLGKEAVVFVASPEVNYVEPHGIADFINKKNKPARGFVLTPGDTICMSSSLVDGTVAKGKYLVPQNNSFKLVVADDLTGNTRFYAEIVTVTTIGYDNEPAVRFVVKGA